MPVLFVVLFAVLVNFSSLLLAQENPLPLLAQEKKVQIRGPRGTDTLAQQTTIGPLRASDTLWRVAERIKPTSPNANVSLYQVMYALYQKNPEAFLDNNLNHLKPNAILKVPSLREVQQVDLNLARQKSEQDDSVWAQRQQAAKAAAAAEAAKTVQQPSSSSTQVSAQWQQELQQIAQQQGAELTEIRTEFNNSLHQVQSLVAENQQLKTTLTAIEVELENLKNQLSQDSELQQQLTSLLSQQAALLRANAEIEAKINDGFNWQQALKSPLAWVLAASIPALLILFTVLLIIKRRTKQTEEAVNAVNIAETPDPSYQSPLPPLDTNDDIDASLFELDEALLEESSADVNFASDTDVSAGLATDIDDDLLDFDDDLLLDDDTLLDDTSTLADSGSEPAAGNEPEPEPFDPDQILSDTDISALLMAEEDDDAIIELADDELADDELADGELADGERVDDKRVDDIADTEIVNDELEYQASVTEEDTTANQDAAEESGPATLSDADLIEHALAEDELEQSDDVEIVTIDLADEDENLTDPIVERSIAQEAKSSVEQADTAPDELNVTDDNSFEFDSSSLDEFAESLAQEDGQAPDLATSEDDSVTKVTDASLAVENPSEVLEQYPDLDLSDDDLTLDIETLTNEEFNDDAVLQQLEDEAELDPLAEQQFDTLMGELEAIAGNGDLSETDNDELKLDSVASAEVAQTENSDFDFSDDDFVEIDKLLASTEQQDIDPERFNQLNVDVGLDEFADVIGKQQPHDVDKYDNGYAAKLDLARAYIEMDDQESAEQILEAIIESDAPEHVKTEATLLIPGLKPE